MLRKLLPDIGKRTLVMGVLNVTPDSFFDRGRFFDKKKAAMRAMEMASLGADVIDIGGESTRPGSKEVPLEEELKRVVPVIESVAGKIKIPVSVDTRKAPVAAAALKAGARIVNDVSALTHDPVMADVAAKYEAAVILMHMKGTPGTMQKSPRYKDVIKDVSLYLKASIKTALSAGIKKDDIIVDPGIGFGKTLEHNLEILRGLRRFKALGCPLCIGTSRKSFIGRLQGSDDPSGRLVGTIASGIIAVVNGADILRVHDVKEAVESVMVADGIIRKWQN